MPILRRDEAPDHLAPTVLYLWRKKWWIIVPAIMVAIAAYLVMRMVPEEFKVTSEIYVSRLWLQDVDPPSPLTVARLLKSAEVLHRVRGEYMENFPDKPVFEKFTRWFSTQTDLVQDTSVRREMSPIIVLQVQATGKKETKFLMESWLRNFIAQFGSYSAAEAAIKRESLLREEAGLEAEIRDAEARQARYHSELEYAGKLLAENIDLLAPADWERPTVTVPSRLSRNATSLQVTMTERNRNVKTQGLYSRLADARIRAATSGTTVPLQERESEIAAVSALIDDTQTSITTLQTRVTELQTSLSAAAREVQVKSEEQRTLRGYMDIFHVGAAMRNTGEGSGIAGADVRVISQPIEPELRTWPKRTMVAGILAVIAAIIAAIMLLFHHYLRSIAERAARRDVV